MHKHDNLWEDFLNKEDIHNFELWEQIDIDLKIMDGSKYLSSKRLIINA
ncbi:hypothetical protein HYD59_00990 [Mycoplasmopsis bovis]|nr:hypothetical protein [Mycoplasmopsis bovis]QQH60947.1 hypothetical protein HYD59_00990 [Mycoplasmopsis bovis]